MQTSIFSHAQSMTFTFAALAACLLLIFIIRAYSKVHNFSHHHYRITGDEVRDTDNENARVL